jgi:hypothetical protein
MRGVPRQRGRNLLGAVVVDGDLQHVGRAQHDAHQIVRAIEGQPGRKTETIAQRRRQQAGAGRRAHQRERLEVERDRPRVGALADDDVEAKVLHGRVEVLLDDGGQAVDLVDEEHVARAEVGEHPGEVALLLYRGARGGVQLCAHLCGEDVGEGGLAEPRGPAEQDVIERLVALARRGGEHAQVVDQFLLADVLVEGRRPQALLEADVVAVAVQDAVALHRHRLPYSLLSASRTSDSSATPSSAIGPSSDKALSITAGR